MHTYHQQWNIILLWLFATLVGLVGGSLSILTLVTGFALGEHRGRWLGP